MRVPASLAAVPLLTGCGAGLLLAENSNPALPLIAAAASLLALATALASFAERDESFTIAAICAGCLLAGLSLGSRDGLVAYQTPLGAWFASRDPDARDAPALFEGVLRADAAVMQAGAAVTVDVVRVDGRPARGGVRLAINGAAPAAIPEWREGRTVRLHALVREPTSYRNPGLADEGRSLARRGMVLVGSVKSAALVEVVSPGNRLNEAAAACRAWARSQLARFVGRWSIRSGAIASAILIGDRSGLPDEDERRLQEAGTYHVIAISGGNIAILTALLMAVLRAARVPPRAGAAVAIVVLIFYGTVAAGGASVSRAITAAVVYLAGRLLDHRGPALNALAIAAVAALAISPRAAADAGFLLSFGATLGILIGAEHLPGWARAPRGTSLMRRAALSAAGLLAATVCAEAALAPIGAVLFSRITFAGLLLNFAAIPLMSVVQAASIVTLLCAPFSAGLAAAGGYVAHVAGDGLVRSAYLVEIAPWLARDVPAPSWGMVSAYYASCGAVILYPRHRPTALGSLLLSLAIMLAGPAAGRGPVAAPAPGHLRVVFFDVGQGDATLVQTPGGQAMLVDAAGAPGSSFDIGERVVAPSLRAFGVGRLDTLVLTHGDPDHIGGAAAAIRRFTPRAIWEGTPVPPHPGLRELAALATARRATWRTVQAGDTERSGDVTIRVLHPPPPDWERQRVRNDDSIVLEIRVGSVSILLPGDIGREPEQSLAPRLSLAQTTIVKAPHHGSATSSTQAFIDAVRPAAVIFSAGRANRFGHPAPAVVARYRAAGALTFGTHEDGAVVVDTDGKQVEISTWSGRRVSIVR